MKLNSKNVKDNKGITLVALVVTIIILLILAGVTIGQLTGNGLFDKIQLAKGKSENAQKEENQILQGYSNEIDAIVGSRDNSLGKELLEETTIYQGNEYDLSDSILNYKSIKIFVGVVTTQAKTDILWEAKEFPTKNIVYYNNENTMRTILPILIGSNVPNYRVPHICFTSDKKIMVRSIETAGWTGQPSDGYKLIVYGN